MIYFFHHYELPVILQQAQIQDILMRNQEGGGPPLRFTHRTSNNNNLASLQDNNLTNNNNQQPREVARAGGFNFAGFRFRYGVVFTTQQATAHHQRHVQQHQQQQPPQEPAAETSRPPNDEEAIVPEAAEEATEVPTVGDNENEASGETTTPIEASSLSDEDELAGGAHGDELSAEAELVEDVAKDLREVSEALRPFLAASTTDNGEERETESTEG